MKINEPGAVPFDAVRSFIKRAMVLVFLQDTKDLILEDWKIGSLEV
jgi:hypothetical protein